MRHCNKSENGKQILKVLTLIVKTRWSESDPVRRVVAVERNKVMAMFVPVDMWYSMKEELFLSGTYCNHLWSAYDRPPPARPKVTKLKCLSASVSLPSTA